MGNTDTPRVFTEATISNLHDLLAREFTRRVVVDAEVDESVVFLALPRDLVEQLGLGEYWTSWGGRRADAVRVEIAGREAVGDPTVIEAGRRVVVGCGVLALMDWVVDVQGRKLIGNPAHGGEHILELL